MKRTRNDKVAQLTTRRYHHGYKATITFYDNGRRLWSETSPGFINKDDALAYARKSTVRFFWMHSGTPSLDWVGNTAYPEQPTPATIAALNKL